MNKTLEELNDLKKEYKKITKELEELSEDELREIIGAGNESIVLPDTDFWHSWNPLPVLDKLNLLNQEEDTKGVEFGKCEFNGSVSNREDK